MKKYSIQSVWIGPSGCGKTHILSAAEKDSFIKSKIQPTIGIDSYTFDTELQGQKAMMRTWDMSGQPRYRSVCSTFMRQAYIIVICFDLSVKDSFEDWNDWYKWAVKYCPDDALFFMLGCQTKEYVEMEAPQAAYEANQLNMDFYHVKCDNLESIRFFMNNIILKSMEKNIQSDNLEITEVSYRSCPCM